MKSPIQQAIDILNKTMPHEPKIIAKITALLEVEKWHMRNMWIDGFNNDTLDTETGRNRFEKEYQEQYNPRK